MHILLVEPYFGGSHRQWAEGYRDASEHEVVVVSHEARFWKWRMEGGFVTLAEAAATATQGSQPPDVVVASSMTNLPAFLGAARDSVNDAATVLYMHENQITYPASHLAQEDLTHAMINWTSAVVADAVWFNSQFHLDDFFDAAPELLGRFPDYRHTHLLDEVRAKSTVVPIGIDLRRFDEVPSSRSHPPLVLWNQRWEHDKNPEEFFAAIDAVSNEDFTVALAGEVFSSTPGLFDEARERLGDRVVHFGYAEPGTYLELLRRADVVVSTALHEFFGVAIVEAIYAGAWPVLPNRLAYPGHIPAALQPDVLYDDFDGLVDLLRRAITEDRPSMSDAVARYDWSVMAPVYDSGIVSLAT